MLTLLRSVISLAVLVAVAYGLFFIELGGRPVAEHVMDVWRSPVMQEKVGLITDEMKRELEQRLAQSGEPRPAAPEFDQRDSEALDEIVGAR